MPNVPPSTTSPPRAKGDQVSLVDSFRRLAAWMRTHDAVVLTDNLSPAAKPLQVLKLEQKLGFAVPPGLRVLWLMHDGQRRAQHGFVGALQLLPVAWVLNERATVQKVLARVKAQPSGWQDSGATPEEAQTEQWLPVARRDTDCVLVHARTGRVFASRDGVPALRLVAPSVARWLAAYADDVEAGRWEVIHDEERTFLARLPPA